MQPLRCKGHEKKNSLEMGNANVEQIKNGDAVANQELPIRKYYFKPR